jgi:hypothetical protein
VAPAVSRATAPSDSERLANTPSRCFEIPGDPGQQEVIKFATVQNYFGFLLGSADTHNIFVFKLGGVGGVTEGTFTGANLLSPGNGNQFSPLTIRDRQYLVCGPRARNLDDDDPGLHGRWLHGLSPQGQVHVPVRMIADKSFELPQMKWIFLVVLAAIFQTVFAAAAEEHGRIKKKPPTPVEGETNDFVRVPNPVSPRYPQLSLLQNKANSGRRRRDNVGLEAAVRRFADKNANGQIVVC